MEKEQLQVFLNNGLSLNRISKIVGKAPSTIKYWINKYGLEIVPNTICPVCRKVIEKKGYSRHVPKCNGLGPRRSRTKYHGKKGGWNAGLTKDTSDIIRKYSDKFRHDYQTGKIVPSGTGRKPSKHTRAKISESLKKFYTEHPERVPYKRNHSSKESYPEKYFRELFENEKIDLKQYKQIGRYELDFYNEQKKIYVEIDGDTHLQPKVIIIDNEKDQYLHTHGWKGLRIKWRDWQKKDTIEKKEVIDRIKLLLI